jgi:pyrimidine operon attenuation protein/uracil phosphoribosyltransferase
LSENILLTSREISRALSRIAHEIIENNKSSHDIVLIGLLTRGVPLAHRLALLIHNFEGGIIPVGALNFRSYRDDISYGINSLNKEQINDSSIQITGNVVVLVDDVLSTGRSIRAAMDALVHLGRPKCIQLAVLIDRGHREIPIRADYVGKNIPSSRKERIQVKLTEIDNSDSVIIIPYKEKQLLKI